MTTLELVAGTVAIALDASDRTVTVVWPDGFDVAGTWTLTVRESVRSTDAVVSVTLDVDGQTTSHEFALADLSDLVPHTDDDDESVYASTGWAGVYAIAQNDIVRLKGVWSVDLTAHRETGS